MRPTLYTMLTVLCVLLANRNYAQQQLTFTYDEAGNQTDRSLVCINCTLPAVATVAENKLAKPDSLATTGRRFTAYPNPVTETLNVQWPSTDNSHIKSIEVFSTTGVRIYHKGFTKHQTETNVSFLHLPSAMYVLRAIYADGKQETLKIIKN